jgi:hypothetical protein
MLETRDRAPLTLQAIVEVSNTESALHGALRFTPCHQGGYLISQNPWLC